MLVWATIATLLFMGSLFVIFNLLRKYEKLEEEYETYGIRTEQRNKELADRVVFIDNEISHFVAIKKDTNLRPVQG